MKRIAIDMDDVLADAEGRFFELAKLRYGLDINPIDLHDKTWAQAANVPHEEIWAWLFEEDFFRKMKVKPHSQEVVKKLSNKYEIFIVSAAVEFPQSMKEKLDWLHEFFPFIDWKYVVFCGHKYMIKADYLIDDHQKNLATFTGKPILYSAYHNKNVKGYTRVEDWKEVEKLLL
jgi:5'-nucleotidase